MCSANTCRPKCRRVASLGQRCLGLPRFAVVVRPLQKVLRGLHLQMQCRSRHHPRSQTRKRASGMYASTACLISKNRALIFMSSSLVMNLTFYRYERAIPSPGPSQPLSVVQYLRNRHVLRGIEVGARVPPESPRALRLTEGRSLPGRMKLTTSPGCQLQLQVWVDQEHPHL